MNNQRLLEHKENFGSLEPVLHTSSLEGKTENQTGRSSWFRRHTVARAKRPSLSGAAVRTKHTTVRPYKLIANAYSSTVFRRGELHVRPPEQSADLSNPRESDFAVAPSSLEPVMKSSSLEVHP